MRNLTSDPAVDVFKIGWVARESGRSVGQRHGSDHRVVGPSAGLCAGTVRDAATRPDVLAAAASKGRVKVGLRLLQTKLARRPLAGSAATRDRRRALRV